MKNGKRKRASTGKSRHSFQKPLMKRFIPSILTDKVALCKVERGKGFG